MLSMRLVSLSLLLLSLAVSSPLLSIFASSSSSNSSFLHLLPYPTSITSGSSPLFITAPYFQFRTDIDPNSLAYPDLQHAFTRYQDLIFPHQPHAYHELELVSLLVSITEPNSISLQLETDESYSLYIPDSSSYGSQDTQALIKATTVYGALRALETFSQLIHFNYSGGFYALTSDSAPITITDTPRFAHRGLLLDTSRHFLPLPSIHRIVDSLAYAKLNVLHWHMTDSQAFPIESRTYPKLWDAAWSEEERYTIEDISSVVEYARQRGVRVMPEIDVPGHADAWCVGYPEVCPSTTCTSPLDPSTDASFNLLTGLVAELTPLFPSAYFHLGGDEVDTSCWSSTPRIASWLQQTNRTTNDAYMYYVERAHDIVSQQKRIPVNWEEVFLNFGSKLDPASVVHIWLSKETLAKATAAGYRALLSNQNVWYLDHLNTPWTDFYLNEPLENITDSKQASLVLGGEVCMWGERIDASEVEATIWPRAAAAAERLWSPRELNDVEAAKPRLEWFRCLLNLRGIGAAPTNNTEAREQPPRPGSCYAQ